MKRLLELNWEAIAGIAAALVALILHLLHLVDTGILLSIALVLLALLLIRDLRRERQEERIRASSERAEVALKEIGSALKTPEAILVGPSELLPATEQFVGRLRGEVVWFNVCLLMFHPQQTFDMLLRPIIENPGVSSVRFISRHSEKELWQEELLPKITACCKGFSKVKEPEWQNWKARCPLSSLQPAPRVRKRHWSVFGTSRSCPGLQANKYRAIFFISRPIPV